MKYKLWFNQPARKQKRQNLREQKSKKQFPIPLKKLQPIIRQSTQRHNHKLRIGKGFTENEIKESGISFLDAISMGIKFDKRRKDRNKETFDRNIERLKLYLKDVKTFKNRKEAKLANATSFKGIILPLEKKKIKTEFIDVREIENFAKQYEIES